MTSLRSQDERFREAVAAMDVGDVATLERLIEDDPQLVAERLEHAGAWLRDVVGGALDSFFERPFLLWFATEDAVRQDRVPDNVVDVMRTIIDAARRYGVPTLQEQLDYALSLAAWSWVAARCGRQIAMLDLLADAGASIAGGPDNALVNGHFEAAEHLLSRGAPLTFAVALCLGRWADVDRMAPDTTPSQRQFAFVLSALKGRAESVQKILALGVDLNAPSKELYSHGTPLHHAVCSGNIETVRVLLAAGADLEAEDTAFSATPLGWAEHYQEETTGEKQARYAAIGQLLEDVTRRGR